MTEVLPPNEESQRAWDGVLFDRFLQYKHLIVGELGEHSETALRARPPREGDRVLDIGCGFGDASLRLAELVGPTGSVLGVDIAPRFVEAAREAAEGIPNLRFEVADVQATPFEDEFDYAFSRFGTMFFANPVAALRNVRSALVPGGTLCCVVWRRREDNSWAFRAEQAVKPHVPPPADDVDEAHCGPGPFAMANADTVSQMLRSAGFERIGFERCDLPYRIGRDLEEAVAFNLALGPAGEALRFAGAEGEALRPELERLLRDALGDLVTPAGVVASSSVWIVSASA